MELKEKELNCTLDAHAYLNLFTLSRCRQMGEKFSMTFISIIESETRINVSKRMYSYTYIVIQLKVIQEFRYVIEHVKTEIFMPKKSITY
jgi:hypothetical protein